MVGVIGLGRLRGSIARRLARGGHRVVVCNRTAKKAFALAEKEENIAAAGSLQQFTEELPAPRTVWVMVTAGEATEEMIRSLLKVLSPGDTMIDGGNWNCVDTLRRALADEVDDQDGFPARMIRPADGDLQWLADEDAASLAMTDSGPR